MEDIFAKRFKELRLQNNYSQQAIGEKLGVGKSTIAAYESGDKKPRPPRLKEISDIFEVSADYLLGTTDDPITKKQTRDLAILLKESTDFHYNGVPISETDLRLFNEILERLLNDSQNAKKSDTSSPTPNSQQCTE